MPFATAVASTRKSIPACLDLTVMWGDAPKVGIWRPWRADPDDACGFIAPGTRPGRACVARRAERIAAGRFQCCNRVTIHGSLRLAASMLRAEQRAWPSLEAKSRRPWEPKGGELLRETTNSALPRRLHTIRSSAQREQCGAASSSPQHPTAKAAATNNNQTQPNMHEGSGGSRCGWARCGWARSMLQQINHPRPASRRVSLSAATAC